MLEGESGFRNFQKIDLESPIELIAGNDFDQPEMAAGFLDPAPGLEKVDFRRCQPVDPSLLPGTSDPFSCLYLVELLTAEQEHHLFRKMNYLKYLAEQRRKELQQSLKTESAGKTGSKVSAIQSCLEQALAIRNYIVTANLRLVVAIARKLVNVDNSLEDLLSQGTVPLIRAVEIFDFERGTRFSTYATWAVRNHLHRVTGKARKYRRKFVTGDTGYFEAFQDERAGWENSQAAQTHVYGLLGAVIDRLSQRDQIIISERFGLFDTDSSPKTFREIGLSLGISTERVRQLLHRSLEKLQGFLEEKDFEMTL